MSDLANIQCLNRKGLLVECKSLPQVSSWLEKSLAEYLHANDGTIGPDDYDVIADELISFLLDEAEGTKTADLNALLSQSFPETTNSPMVDEIVKRAGKKINTPSQTNHYALAKEKRTVPMPEFVNGGVSATYRPFDSLNLSAHFLRPNADVNLPIAGIYWQPIHRHSHYTDLAISLSAAGFMADEFGVRSAADFLGGINLWPFKRTQLRFALEATPKLTVFDKTSSFLFPVEMGASAKQSFGSASLTLGVSSLFYLDEPTVTGGFPLNPNFNDALLFAKIGTPHIDVEYGELLTGLESRTFLVFSKNWNLPWFGFQIGSRIFANLPHGATNGTLNHLTVMAQVFVSAGMGEVSVETHATADVTYESHKSRNWGPYLPQLDPELLARDLATDTHDTKISCARRNPESMANDYVCSLVNSPGTTFNCSKRSDTINCYSTYGSSFAADYERPSDNSGSEIYGITTPYSTSSRELTHIIQNHDLVQFVNDTVYLDPKDQVNLLGIISVAAYGAHLKALRAKNDGNVSSDKKDPKMMYEAMREYLTGGSNVDLAAFADNMDTFIAQVAVAMNITDTHIVRFSNPMQSGERTAILVRPKGQRYTIISPGFSAVAGKYGRIPTVIPTTALTIRQAMDTFSPHYGVMLDYRLYAPSGKFEAVVNTSIGQALDDATVPKRIDSYLRYEGEL